MGCRWRIGTEQSLVFTHTVMTDISNINLDHSTAYENQNLSHTYWPMTTHSMCLKIQNKKEELFIDYPLHQTVGLSSSNWLTSLGFDQSFIMQQCETRPCMIFWTCFSWEPIWLAKRITRRRQNGARLHLLQWSTKLYNRIVGPNCIDFSLACHDCHHCDIIYAYLVSINHKTFIWTY